MKKIIFVLAAISLLGVSSCEEEKISRYPSVNIPQFSDEDYYAQLSDKNPEVVYNAIVNLGGRAGALGRLLSDKKVDKNSFEYIAAEKKYHKIIELLNAREADIVAASLRFLQLFANGYDAKAELINPVLQIKSDNPQVIYEQIITLKSIVDKNTSIADSVLLKFLNNPSWIVSRSSYLLIDKLENENLRKDLLMRYKTASSEGEKLLILTAFQNQPGDNIEDFFFEEILTAKSNKIRYAVYDILGNCKDKERVLARLAENYGKIIPNDRKYLFEHYAMTMEEYFSSRVLKLILSNGFIPDRNFLKLLDEKLEEYSGKTAPNPRDKEYLYDLETVEKALVDGKVMAVYWQSLRLERKALDAKINSLQTEYDVIAKEFSAKADKIFKKYGVSEKVRKEYMENVINSRETLEALFEPDEENTKQE